MTQQPSRDRIGATPGKLALVAVLSLALVGVIASNWLGDAGAAEPLAAVAPAANESVSNEPASNEPERPLPTPPPGETPPGDAPDNPFGEFADDAWPRPSLREATAFDPLAPPAWAAPPAAVEGALTEEQIHKLLTSPNAIIFLSGDTRMARIGDREFRVGDTIGHFRISDISSEGVVLSEIP